MIVLMSFGITWFSYIATSGNIFSPLYSWFVFYVDKGKEIDKRYIKSLWDSFLYMKSMKSSNVSYKQTLQIKGGVNLFHFKPIPLKLLRPQGPTLHNYYLSILHLYPNLYIIKRNILFITVYYIFEINTT